MTREAAESCKARMEARWPGAEYVVLENDRPSAISGGFYVRLVRRAGSGAPAGADPMPLPAGRT